MKPVHFLFLIPFCWLACQSVDSPKIGEVPAITLLNTAPVQVVEYQDSIVFTLEYTDGDGDLGTNDDTQRNVFAADNRVDVVHEFRLKQLAPDGAEIPITGTFTVTLDNTVLTGGGTEETVSFRLWVRDQAGNLSNEVASPPITVKAQ
ncbi:MAG: hypothetical protein AAF399_15685 [Bacteroidota bacterium]